MALTRDPDLNGRMPSWRLASVPWEPHQRVQVDALPSLKAMNAAYRKATGTNLDITDSYRPLEGYWGQIATMLRRYKPLAEFRRMHPSWSSSQIKGRKSHLWNGVRRYLLPGEAQVAFPGTSNHGWGLAIDFGTACRWWVQQHGAPFGWVWPDWAHGVEPWHIEATAAVVLIDDEKQDTDIDIDLPDLDLPDDLEKQMTDAILERIATVRSGQGVHDAKLDTLLDYARKAHVTRAAHTQTLAVIKAAVTGSPAPVVDETALAHALAVELAPALTAAVLDALPAPEGLSPDEHRALAEQAIRNVLGSLDTP